MPVRVKPFYDWTLAPVLPTNSLYKVGRVMLLPTKIAIQFSGTQLKNECHLVCIPIVSDLMLALAARSPLGKNGRGKNISFLLHSLVLFCIHGANGFLQTPLEEMALLIEITPDGYCLIPSSIKSIAPELSNNVIHLYKSWKVKNKQPYQHRIDVYCPKNPSEDEVKSFYVE
jgi:hypothetical protein